MATVADMIREENEKRRIGGVPALVPAPTTPTTPAPNAGTSVDFSSQAPAANPDVLALMTGQTPASAYAPTPAPLDVRAGQAYSVAKPYTVSAGDTLQSIALKFGVPPNQITGYRSGDPNKIFPGEMLSIGIGGGGVPDVPTAPTATPTPTPAPTPKPTTTTPVNAPKAPASAPVTPSPTAPVAPSSATTFQTPSGKTVDAQGNLIAPTPTPAAVPTPDAKTLALQELLSSDRILKEYGFDPSALQFGFNTNPAKTVKDLVTEVMSATGLPDAKTQITSIANDIESIENARDREIGNINDNPFISTGTKSERIQAVADRYEKKIDNRTRKLTLLQGVYDDARQEAQFAATTAINLYDKNRNFNQGQFEFLTQQAEKALEAKQKLTEPFTLSPGGRRYTFDEKTGQYKLSAAAPAETVDLSGIFGGGASTPSGGTGGGAPTTTTPTDPQAAQAALQVILGSGKFTKEQRADVVRAVQSGGDPLTVLRNQAKALLGSTGENKVTNMEVAREQLAAIRSALTDYYAQGGDTGLFKGTYEKVLNRLGNVDDPNLVDIATQIQSALQIYRNAVSGTAYSVQEGADIASIFPGINKSQGLNEAILNGRDRAFDTTIDSYYRSALGSSYDKLKKSYPTAPSTPSQPSDEQLLREFQAKQAGLSAKDINYLRPVDDFFRSATKAIFAE